MDGQALPGVCKASIYFTFFGIEVKSMIGFSINTIKMLIINAYLSVPNTRPKILFTILRGGRLKILSISFPVK